MQEKAQKSFQAVESEQFLLSAKFRRKILSRALSCAGTNYFAQGMSSMTIQNFASRALVASFALSLAVANGAQAANP